MELAKVTPGLLDKLGVKPSEWARIGMSWTLTAGRCTFKGKRTTSIAKGAKPYTISNKGEAIGLYDLWAMGLPAKELVAICAGASDVVVTISEDLKQVQVGIPEAVEAEQEY